MKAIILAGGSGERFWPLSTKETPKQFLNLFGDTSLIEQTCERILDRFSPEDILIITSGEHVGRTKELLPLIPSSNIIGEPMRRNTAAACLLGARLSAWNEINLVVPADHRIPEPAQFWIAFDKAVSALMEYGGLFTFGIQPTRPDTGYGYIEAGEEISRDVFEVKRFMEKPDQETAEKFVDHGGYLWNSGMFLWRASDLEEEIRSCSPDIYNSMKDIDPSNIRILEAIYPMIPSRSIDYAVMELSRKVRMVKGTFKWSDVGNWNSIQELEGYTEPSSRNLMVDSKNVYIRSTGNKPIGVIGMEGIIVVETADGLLICSEDKVQKVREISKALSGKQ